MGTVGGYARNSRGLGIDAIQALDAVINKPKRQGHGRKIGTDLEKSDVVLTHNHHHAYRSYQHLRKRWQAPHAGRLLGAQQRNV
jgi:hypothetical protein